MQANPPEPPTPAPHLPRLARRLVAKDVTARKAVWLIGWVTMALAVAGGVLIWLLDKEDFSSLGQGLWWSLQTVTTVGYGDVVPHNAEGRIIAAFVMLTGIGFIAVITAAVTASLIEGARRGEREATHDEIVGGLRALEERLAAIESRLSANE